jgi:hypothetical protein
VRYGNTKGVPLWAEALVLAEKGWGHPQDIMEKRGGVVWRARQAILDQARAKSAKMDKKS